MQPSSNSKNQAAFEAMHASPVHDKAGEKVIPLLTKFQFRDYTNPLNYGLVADRVRQSNEVETSLK